MKKTVTMKKIDEWKIGVQNNKFFAFTHPITKARLLAIEVSPTILYGYNMRLIHWTI